MKINSIQPTNFSAGVKINSVDNRHCQYLYNKIQQMTKDFKIPANFRTHEIELPSVSKAVIEKLKELGIKFN